MTRLAPLCLLLFTGAAVAQTSPWYIGASQTFTQESNLYRLADGAATPDGVSKADLISSTALLAGLDQPLGRQRVYGSATLRSSKFRDNKDLDNEGYALRAGLDWETVNRLSGTLEASAERSLARFNTDTELGVQTRRNIEDQTRLLAEARVGVVTVRFGEPGERQVHPQVVTRVGGDISRYLLQPGTGRHDTGGIHRAIFQSLKAGLILRMRHCQVIRMNDQKFGINRITKALDETGLSFCCIEHPNDL